MAVRPVRSAGILEAAKCAAQPPHVHLMLLQPQPRRFVRRANQRAEDSKIDLNWRRKSDRNHTRSSGSSLALNSNVCNLTWAQMAPTIERVRRGPRGDGTRGAGRLVVQGLRSLAALVRTCEVIQGVSRAARRQSNESVRRTAHVYTSAASKSEDAHAQTLRRRLARLEQADSRAAREAAQREQLLAAEAAELTAARRAAVQRERDALAATTTAARQRSARHAAAIRRAAAERANELEAAPISFSIGCVQAADGVQLRVRLRVNADILGDAEPPMATEDRGRASDVVIVEPTGTQDLGAPDPAVWRMSNRALDKCQSPVVLCVCVTSAQACGFELHAGSALAFLTGLERRGTKL